jgi:hypothetical protein
LAACSNRILLAPSSSSEQQHPKQTNAFSDRMGTLVFSYRQTRISSHRTTLLQ